MFENSFTNWVHENLADYLEDIYLYGCSAGFPGITYYADTRALYDMYEDDIWDILNDEVKKLGETSVLSWAASMCHIESAAGFENWMVWAAVEVVASAAQMKTEEEEKGTE